MIKINLIKVSSQFVGGKFSEKNLRENFGENDKFCENLRENENFSKTFAKTKVLAKRKYFAKSKNYFLRNFRENTKTKIFVSTLARDGQKASVLKPHHDTAPAPLKLCGFRFNPISSPTVQYA
jgi:hypothetical protein